MLELLETEQAYVARLHLLDQASGDSSTPTISGVPTAAQDIIGSFGAASEPSPLAPHALPLVLTSFIYGSPVWFPHWSP